MHTASNTRFCIIRHGETDWNLERRIQGQLDIPLNNTGSEQARLVANHLAEYPPFDFLYVSDLTRTRQTAEPIAAVMGLAPHITPSLRERHYGELQGLTYPEMAAQHPVDHAQLKARVPEYIPPGGESLQHLAARIQDFFCTLAELHRGTNILIVTHGGVLDIAYRLACAQPLALRREFSMPNAALNWIAHGGSAGWLLERWGDIGHLNKPLDEIKGL